MNQIIQWVQSLPKLLLGSIVIIIGLGAIVYNDPPTTLCDIQMENVNRKLAGSFFSNRGQGRDSGDGQLVGGSREGRYKSGVMDAFKFCIKTNSPGGCFDIFNRLNFFEKQIKTIPEECGYHPSTAAIRKALEKGLKLMAEVAWGDQPPETAYEQTSWLDISDIALFCRLSREHKRLYGKKTWSQFRSRVLRGLPEAKTLKPKKLWSKSLFSYPCKKLL